MSIKQEAYQTTIKGSDTDYRFYNKCDRTTFHIPYILDNKQ